MEPAYTFARTLLKPWGHAWFRLEARNVEAIPARGPAIVAFNHIAYLDALAAMWVIDKAKRRARFLAKAELWEDARLRWLLDGTRQIPVRRGTPAAPAALEAAVSALRAGEVVAVFPEGSASSALDLRTRSAKSGAARLGLATGVPLIPAAIWGTQNVWPKDMRKNWRPRQRIIVSVGEPLTYEGNPGSVDDFEALGKRLVAEIEALAAELRPLILDRRRSSDPPAGDPHRGDRQRDRGGNQLDRDDLPEGRWIEHDYPV